MGFLECERAAEGLSRRKENKMSTVYNDTNIYEEEEQRKKEQRQE